MIPVIKKTVILIGLLIVELILGSIVNIGAVRPPFFVLAVIIFFWNMSIGERLLLALGAGALLDLISPVPFGTFVLALILVGGLTQIWRRVFSHTDSFVSQALGATLSLAVCYACAIIFSLFLYEFSLSPVRIGGIQTALGLFGIGVLWSIFLPLFYFSGGYFLKLVRK